MPHKVVVVTPAGRRHYLDLLSHYVTGAAGVDKWVLWDNCRRQEDRDHIEEMARRNPLIEIVRVDNPDGSNRTVNKFYKFCNDPGTFYIKMDDDLVYLAPDLPQRLYRAALRERDTKIWWSPLVVNNAICTWLLKYHSQITVDAGLTAQAGCAKGWRSPIFAERLHRVFLESAGAGAYHKFETGNFDVSLARFSINCIGYFGDDVAALGEKFCPENVDDEEWISAVLPSIAGRPGRIIGDIHAAHFSYFTQEHHLLGTDILEQYYALAGLSPAPYERPRRVLKDVVKRYLLVRFSGGLDPFRIEAG